MENFRSPYKTFVVTFDGVPYTVRAHDMDEAACSAYRKHHKGKVNVYDSIFWYTFRTGETFTVREVEDVRS